MKNILISLLVITMLNSSGCNDRTQKHTVPQKPDNTVPKKDKINNISIEEPENNDEFVIGDEIHLTIKQKKEDQPFDSLLVYYDNQIVRKLSPMNLTLNWKPDSENVGKHKIKIATYYQDYQTEYDYCDLTFRSDIEPEWYTAKVINEYKHDNKAFTQGLLIEDGFMYEATGRNKESSIRKVNYKTGEVISNLSIPDKYFGEGISVFGDKIYQLTWTSRKGFVYDLKSFSLIQTFEYPTQGWGLTTDGNILFMSDGSEKIFIIEHEFFGELDMIEVFDQNGPVKKLNELEYIDGLLYANVWQTGFFVIIDPNTGKVLKKVDCSHLIPEEYKNDREYVLNGIAYNKETKQLFITGKYWPKLYEIELVKK